MFGVTFNVLARENWLIWASATAQTPGLKSAWAPACRGMHAAFTAKNQLHQRIYSTVTILILQFWYFWTTKIFLPPLRSVPMKWHKNKMNGSVCMRWTYLRSQNVNHSCIGSASDKWPLQPPFKYWKSGWIISGTTASTLPCCCSCSTWPQWWPRMYMLGPMSPCTRLLRHG